MKSIGLLFPHQLFMEHELVDQCEVIYLVEELLFFKQFKFHKQKLCFHRASMMAYKDHLTAMGSEVHYISSPEKISDVRILLGHISKAHQSFKLYYIDPTDDWLHRRLKKGFKEHGMKTEVFENPFFINTPADLEPFFGKEKKFYFQTSFYQQQRKRLNILMDDDGKPLGGKWSYDDENRKKFPKKSLPPPIHWPEPTDYWSAAAEYVAEYFDDNPGQLTKTCFYPLTHEAAQSWLKQFLEFRFHYFGDYEDAIVQADMLLHHSLLSPLMNVGLILPKEILDAALEAFETQGIGVNSVEGFVRQIIGWREFIRGMYEHKGRQSRTTNYWGFTRKIPASFYDGTTGILPLDNTIKKVVETGYCHHIERLMILGNFMILCEFDPDEVYRWFMELFIDAYDWVMVPNVYGMSQFADGGLFATKPYISGSNYLKKMSNYPSGEWQQIWDGLFWRFISVHQDFFKSNPRSSMMFYSWNRMDESKQNTHLSNANTFLKSLD